MKRRQVLFGACAASVTVPLFASTPALRIMVAYPPGGVSDSVARVLARQLTPILDRAVVVENRAGVGGGLALAEVARAAPDGRLLGFSAISPLALSPHFGQPEPRVVPVSGVMHTPLLLVGTSALVARNFADMVREARAAHPGLRWATSGVGTIGHLALEQVKLQMKLDLVHVPYTGGAPQLQDALAARFELLSSNLAPLQLDYVRTGRLFALAVGAPHRSGQLPAVPTFAEAGCAGANLSSLFGLFAPAGTPAALVKRFNAACAEVLGQPEFRRMLAEGGNQPATGSAADFAQEIRRQREANGKLVAMMKTR
ncbi:MAG: tripartite tricarboxylate transporter substrate binding protein [Burkholderiales bacterium]|nr:tripartite tricarboxylate transporter substrate binding protein [Burkholderiales bacterium]